MLGERVLTETRSASPNVMRGRIVAIGAPSAVNFVPRCRRQVAEPFARATGKRPSASVASHVADALQQAPREQIPDAWVAFTEQSLDLGEDGGKLIRCIGFEAIDKV
jgi:hypothetical protein